MAALSVLQLLVVRHCSSIMVARLWKTISHPCSTCNLLPDSEVAVCIWVEFD
jgi:hypothetical protein